MTKEEYCQNETNEFMKFRNMVINEGSNIIKLVLDDEWFDKTLMDAKEVWLENREDFSGKFFPFRWLYEEKQWSFINIGLKQLDSKNPKKEILRNKLKETITENWMHNTCSAFEITSLCKFELDGILVEIEPRINDTTYKKADALIRIDKRELLIEISSFETDIELIHAIILNGVRTTLYRDSIDKVKRKIVYKTQYQLSMADRPNILLITLPYDFATTHSAVEIAVSEFLKESISSNVSAIVVFDGYILKSGRCYFNSKAKYELTDAEKNYFLKVME
ncbi:MAG: hypothetical protein VB122_07965 [Erysipelotrichales bacterium]|nr:hypothetical protein [Erysipelotrichales bacterium]